MLRAVGWCSFVCCLWETSGLCSAADFILAKQRAELMSITLETAPQKMVNQNMNYGSYLSLNHMLWLSHAFDSWTSWRSHRFATKLQWLSWELLSTGQLLPATELTPFPFPGVNPALLDGDHVCRSTGHGGSLTVVWGCL